MLQQQLGNAGVASISCQNERGVPIIAFGVDVSPSIDKHTCDSCGTTEKTKTNTFVCSWLELREDINFVSFPRQLLNTEQEKTDTVQDRSYEYFSKQKFQYTKFPDLRYYQKSLEKSLVHIHTVMYTRTHAHTHNLLWSIAISEQ